MLKLNQVHARPENKEDQSIGACLMRIRDKNGAPLDMDILHANIAVFFFAGFDTTGTSSHTP
jgi:cytochrome P450